MASKSVLKLGAIQDFFGQYAVKALERGENALEAGHLIKFMYDGTHSIVQAKVQASMKDRTYDVNISFSRTKVLVAECNCARGQVSCHHMAAVLLHLHKTVSITDTQCSWAARSAPKSDGKPIEDLYGTSKKGELYRAVTGLFPSREKWIEALSQVDRSSGACAGVSWILSLEPPVPETNPAFVKLVQPRDVILSDEYGSAEFPADILRSRLAVPWETTVEVAQLTTGQAANEFWSRVREWRITASCFGDVLASCRGRRSGSVAPSLLKRLYSPPNLSRVQATMWGRDHEEPAIAAFAANTGLQVSKTGVWLHESGLIGASPDGLVGDDGVIEVKCPYKYREQELEEVLSPSGDTSYIAWFEDGSWMVNQHHPYYDQIQGELLCTRRTMCHLVLFTLKSLIWLKVPFDPVWSKNVDVLIRFYTETFAPYVRAREKTTQS